MKEGNAVMGKPNQFSAVAYETDLANLMPTIEMYGMLLTAFLLLEKGKESPYIGCIVEIVEGPDAGKQFVANVGKPNRLAEPLTIRLVSEVDSK